MDPNISKEKIREWVSLQSGVSIKDLNDDTPLLDGDLLDSFGQMSLSLLIEELIGREISVQEISRLENFKSIRSIALAFFRTALTIDSTIAAQSKSEDI